MGTMKDKTKEAFYMHRSKSRRRGIKFDLTYAQWLRIWIKSGHFSERGRKLGQYCMARFGDRGPYSVGNVQIISHSQNTKEKKISAATRNRMSTSAIKRCFRNGYVVAP